MSDKLEAALSAISTKLDGQDIGGSVKFAIADLGEIYVDESGVRISDDDADVTLNADVESFEAMLEGDLDPTTAFMTGKLSIDGDMGLAMKLAPMLS